MGTLIETNYSFSENLPGFPFSDSFPIKLAFASNFVFEIGLNVSNNEYKFAIAIVTACSKKYYIYNSIPADINSVYDVVVLKDHTSVRVALYTDLGSPNYDTLVVIDYSISNGDISSYSVAYYYPHIARTIRELSFNVDDINEVFSFYGNNNYSSYSVQVSRFSLDSGHVDDYNTTFDNIRLDYDWVSYAISSDFVNNDHTSFVNAQSAFYWDKNSNQTILLKAPITYHKNNSDYYILKSLNYSSGKYVHDIMNEYLFDLKNQISITLPLYIRYSNIRVYNIINSEHVIVFGDGIIIEYDEQGNFIRAFDSTNLNDSSLDFIIKDSNGYFGHNSQQLLATQDQIDNGTQGHEDRINDLSSYQFFESSMTHSDTDYDQSTIDINLDDTSSETLYSNHFNIFNSLPISITSNSYEKNEHDYLIFSKPVKISWGDIYTDIVSIDQIRIKTSENKYIVNYDDHEYTLQNNDIIGIDEIDTTVGCNYGQFSEIVLLFNYLRASFLSSNFFPFFC